ncbi:MAG: DUF4928 family protein [Burkholderiales bacterium]|nr:DUF4928 family protein [Phycisphaerae bacterium]
MPLIAEAIQIVDEWYASLDLYQDRLPSKGSIAAALHVLNRLRDDYELDIAAHVASGEAQITGLSANALKRLLSEFGESRILSSVGGRSNRGARGDVAKLLESMRGLGLTEQPVEIRVDVLRAMQQHIVANYVGLYFAAKRVKALFEPSSTTERSIGIIIENARQSGKAGPVAEYLVGAKLELRFPDKLIRNKRFSTSDTQGGYSGDFEIGNTVFHVTVSPMPELFEKLKANLDRGLRVYLLVPRGHVVGTQQNVDLIAPGRITVVAIETFVATNIDEINEFDGTKLKSGFRALLEKYNARVEDIELDKSLLIDLPPNL